MQKNSYDAFQNQPKWQRICHYLLFCVSTILEHSLNLRLILFCKLCLYTPLGHFRVHPLLLLPIGNMHAHSILRIYSNLILLFTIKVSKKSLHIDFALSILHSTYKFRIKETWNKKYQKFKILTKSKYLFSLRWSIVKYFQSRNS